MKNTSISWTHILGPGTGSSWNPIQAINKETGAKGHFCIKVSEGCKFCYAEHMNLTSPYIGTKLPYSVASLGKVEMQLSLGNGQTGIDWPLRAKKSQGIFPCDMTDWLGFEFVPIQWSNQLLSIMLLAQHHIFLTLTKRWSQLEKMLTYMTQVSKGMEVPNFKTFDQALMKTDRNWREHWEGGNQALIIRNTEHSAFVPWPPPNIFFGISICTQKEAERALPILLRIKKLSPAFKTWISYEPALDPIDFREGDWRWAIDWLVVGGESGAQARYMPAECVSNSIDFGMYSNIPIYVKQLGSAAAKELGLKDSKGQDVPKTMKIRQFPDVSKSYIPWK